MKRSFREVFEDEEEEEADGLGRLRTRGTGYSDMELESRFSGTGRIAAADANGGEGGGEVLMDEETVKRLLAEERRQEKANRERLEREESQATEDSLLEEVAMASPLKDEPLDGDEQRADATGDFLDESEVITGLKTPEPPPGSVPITHRLQSEDRTEPMGAPRPLGPGAPPPDVRATSSTSGATIPLKAGDPVVLRGLKAAAHLNGQRGLLLRFDATTGRWEVKLPDGDVKAIKVENLQSEAPAAAAQQPGSGMSRVGEVAGLSSASLSAPPPPMSGTMPAASTVKNSGSGRASGSTGGAAAQPRRRMGTVRWYNGRRKLGVVMPDGGGPDLFIPAQGALNGSQVPPQPGGLFHGTRVSFLPAALKSQELVPQGGKAKKPDIVCMDVRPVPGQVGLSCGVDTHSGAKEHNDDRIAAQDLTELGFCAGVFDGHRGSLCAEFLSKQLPRAILEAFRARVKRSTGGVAKITSEQEANMISSAIVDGFEAMDKAFLITAKKKDLHDGSTAILGLLSHGFQVPVGPVILPGKWANNASPATVARCPGGIAKLFLAWCGDSRAVLLRGRQGLKLTEDHRPSRKDEQERIKKAGGCIVQDAHGIFRVGPREKMKLAKELEKRRKKEPSEMKWFMATSRAFGDKELKEPDPIVVATPEVKVVDLAPDDWAVLLASDGVYDRLSPQTAADTIYKAMVLEHKDVVQAAKAIVQTALKSGSRDNLTAVVMRLGWSNPPAPDAQKSASAEEPQAKDDVNMFG